jgi:hypothetical protein
MPLTECDHIAVRPDHHVGRHREAQSTELFPLEAFVLTQGEGVGTRIDRRPVDFHPCQQCHVDQLMVESQYVAAARKLAHRTSIEGRPEINIRRNDRRRVIGVLGKNANRYAKRDRRLDRHSRELPTADDTDRWQISHERNHGGVIPKGARLRQR